MDGPLVMADPPLPPFDGELTTQANAPLKSEFHMKFLTYKKYIHSVNIHIINSCDFYVNK